MSASVSTVVTEAWSVENYQQPGTVLVLAHRMNSGSDAIKNNCIPYAVKGRVYCVSWHASMQLKESIKISAHVFIRIYYTIYYNMYGRIHGQFTRTETMS